MDLDLTYGEKRAPQSIDPWENLAPVSLSTLDGNLASELAALETAAQGGLFRAAARTFTYIWAMDGTGAVKMAMEELALRQPDARFGGYPRRRGYSHPAESKKLGHPTLLNGGEARIAGELAFDELGGRLRWVLNANSGRYCRHKPPTENQLGNVSLIFRQLGIDPIVDMV